MIKDATGQLFPEPAHPPHSSQEDAGAGNVAATRTSISRTECSRAKDNNRKGETLLLEPASLLDEAHEGSDAGPGAHHEHRVAGLEGQAELGLADEHRNGGLVAVVRYQLVLQPGGGHALVEAPSLGLVLHHHGADVDAVGVDLGDGE